MVRYAVANAPYEVAKAYEAFNTDESLKYPKQQESVETIGANAANVVAKLKA